MFTKLKKVIALCVVGCLALSFTLMGYAESGESATLTNILQGKEVYSPYTVNKDGEAANLIDGKLDTKWCSNQFQTAENNTEPVFVMIKLGSSAIKACGFRLYNSSLNEGEFTSIREFKIYTTNDDSMWNKAKNSDFITSKFTLVYDSIKGLVPISAASKYDTQSFIDSPVWPLPKGVTFDVKKSHYGIIKDMVTTNKNLMTYEKFQKTFDAKYVVFQVTGNMDANPRVPELMIFKGTSVIATTSSVKATSSTKSTSSVSAGSSSIAEVAALVSKNANVVVDATAKTITVNSEMTVDELKSAFAPASSIKIIDASGTEMTSGSAPIVNNCKVNYKNIEYLVIVTTSSSTDISSSTNSSATSAIASSSSTTGGKTSGSNMLWLWIVIGIVIIGGAGTAVYNLFVRKKGVK